MIKKVYRLEEREEKERLYKVELEGKRGHKKVAVDLRKEIEKLKVTEDDGI